MDHELKVKDLMSTELVTLEKDARLDLAREIMRLARIRHLPVTDGKRLVGLVTHRDLLRAQVSILAGLSNSESEAIESSIPVSKIMIPQVESTHPGESALEAAKRMRKWRHGCLPVVDNDELVGILTEADFLDLVIRALQ